MSLFKPASNFIAQCEMCNKLTQLLSNDPLISLYILMDRYGWIVFKNGETIFCSERCLDEYEIEHIDEMLNDE